MSARILSVILAVGLGVALRAGAGTTTTVTRAVMTDTNAALVWPTATMFANSNAIPTKVETTNLVSGSTNSILVTVTNVAKAATNNMGSAAYRSAGFTIGSLLPLHDEVGALAAPQMLATKDEDGVNVTMEALSASDARTAIGCGSAATLTQSQVIRSRPGGVWPRTFIASGFNYYNYGAVGGSALASIAYGFDAFPQGMYTNVARIACQIRFSTYAGHDSKYATNFTIRVTGAGPLGPAGGALVVWSSATDWSPTNSGTWVFSDAGGVGYCSTTGIVVNKRAPVYDTYSAVHLPFVYLINGADPVTNATMNYVIEYDNWSND